MSDESRVPFALAARLSVAVDKSSIIILAEIAAGSIGMGLGGIIPLCPYFLIADSTGALKISVAATFVCLFFLAILEVKLQVSTLYGHCKSYIDRRFGYCSSIWSCQII